MKCNQNLSLIFFKARLDSGNEEMIQKLKDQLKETHEELDQSKQELQSKEEQVQAVRQEVSSVWATAVLYAFLISFSPKLSTERN